MTITKVTGATFADGVGEIPITVTITDNENPIFSILDTTVETSESDEAEIVVQITNPSETAVSFTYSTSTSSASSLDFEEQIATQLSFDPQAGNRTLIIPITDDEIDEVDESFTVTFADLRGATFSGGTSPTVTVTIEDDDQTVIRFEDRGVSFYEFYGGSREMEFDLRLSTHSSRDISVDWEASSNNLPSYYIPATRGVDYAVAQNSHQGTATIPAGSLTATIGVPITNDDIYEREEYLSVSLSNPTSGANIGHTSATGYIYNDDNQPVITAPESISVSESDGNIEIPISLSNSSYREVSFYYSTGSAATDNASVGLDFQTISDFYHTIPAFTSSSIISIPILEDDLFEGPETFTVVLFEPSNAEVLRNPSSQTYNQRQITVTIIDAQEAPEISFAEIAPSVDESDNSVTIRARLSSSINRAISVSYSTADMTATGGAQSGSGADYQTQTNQTLNFSAGATFADITIPIYEDSIGEGNETFALTLSNPRGAEFVNVRSTLTSFITIVDDESPTLIAPTTISVSERVGLAPIELQLSGLTNRVVQISYSTIIDGGSNAAQQADFTSQPFATVSIPQSRTTGIIYIPITNDTISESDETFIVRLSRITGAQFANGASSVDIGVTINDDEGLPTLSVDSTSIEITEGSGSAEVGLTLSSAASGPVAVTYSTKGLTASNDGSDYTVRTSSVKTITSGTKDTISIPIMDDGVLEDNEKFIVEITGVSGAAFGLGRNKIVVEVTIIDKEPLPTLLIPFQNVYAIEYGNAVINIRLSKPTDTPVTFTYSTTTDSATSADFTEQNSVSHTIASGVRSRIRIPITSDEIDEIDEQFNVTFSKLRGATFGSTGAPRVTVTIEDNDQASFIVSNGRGTESSTGTSYVEFPVQLSRVSSRNTSATWTASTELTDEAVRGVDFAGESNSHTGTVEIPAGSRSATILVPIVDDEFEEPTESFTLTLTNPSEGAGILVGTAVGTISDNDRGPNSYRPVLTASTSVSVSEADGNVAIPLNLSYKAEGSVRVWYSTRSGIASSGTDFANRNNERHDFPENTTSSSILIPITNDAFYEGPESFTVTLNSVSGADFPLNPASQYSYYYDRLRSIEITVTIFDDETKPVVSFDNLTPDINETGSSLTIRANLSHASAIPASVIYSTENITATGGSGSGTGIDYQTQTNQTLNFSANSRNAQFTIPIYNDTMKEGNETFAVTFSDANGVTIANQSETLTAIATIVDDESPTLSVVDTTVEVGEREGYAAIDLMLTGSTDEDVVVNYATTREAGDTAETADFMIPNPQTVTISSTQTTGEIRIPIVNDSEANEGDETFTVTLTGITQAEFAGGSNIVVKVTIKDDEGLPTLTVDSESVEVYEGLGPVEIGVILDSVPSGNVLVTYSTEDNTADETDYTLQTDETITILSNQTTGKISIPITSDSNYEGNETFNVNITGVSGAAFEENVREISKTVTILDDEPVPTLSVQSTSLSVPESGNAEIVLQLVNPSNETVSFTYSTNEGTATNADFVAQNNVLYTFGSETTSMILIPIISDEIDEVDEIFTVTFANLTGATFGHAGAPTVSVTIEDDDQAEIFFVNSHESLNEGEADSRRMAFHLRLTTVSSRDISVDWEATSEGLSAYFPAQFIATRGIDYAVPPNPHLGKVVFPAGSLTTIIYVQIANDTIDDDLECFTVVLSNPTGGAVIGNQSGIGVINGPAGSVNLGNTSVLGHIDDDDDSPTISVPTAISGREVDGKIEIPISLSHETNEEVSVSYSATAGNATGNGIDFENVSNLTHVIPNNTVNSKIVIPIINDKLFEGNETFTVTLSNPVYARFPNSPISQYSGQSLGSMEIIVTIFDDETEPVISLEEMMPRVNESEGTLIIRANLSNASTEQASLTYTTTNSTATGGTGIGNGVDYATQSSQTLNFPIGQAYADITIPIYQDEISEGDEIFILTLSSATNANFPNSASELMLMVTIVDDEMPTLSVVDSSLNVNKSSSIGAIELQLSAPARETVVVTYSTSIESGDTAVAADLEVITSETISIVSPGTTGMIAIPIKNNTASIGDKTFTLTLSAISGATFAGGSSSIMKKVSIMDDTGLPTLSVDSTKVSVGEGEGNASINLSLSPAHSSNVTVKYTTFGATASNDGSDYTPKASVTKTITASETTAVINIPIINDTAIEGNETFVVTLSELSGATFGPNISKLHVVVTILDDEAPLTLTVADTNVSAAEGTNAEIGLRLNKSGTATVTYSTSAITALNDGSDYDVKDEATQTITSSTKGMISIPTISDTDVEDNETFAVIITSVSGAVFESEITQIRIIVTIIDDDIASFSIADSSVAEGDAGFVDMEFTVSLNKESITDSTVTWTASTETSNDATLGTDYAVATNSHTGIASIVAGETSTKIKIPIAGDEIFEPSETFTVTLSNPTGLTDLGDAVATGTITNDDSDFTILIDDTKFTANISEGGGRISIPVSLNKMASDTITVSYTTVDGTAIGSGDNVSDPDFTSKTDQTLEFKTGEMAKNIEIEITDDNLNELEEKFTVVLSQPSGAAFEEKVDSISIEITIADNEDPILSLSNSTFSFPENGSNIVIDLERTGLTDSKISYQFAIAGGTAIAGDNGDYTIPDELTGEIPIGSNTGSITIPVVNDNKNEGKETFNLTVSILGDNAVFTNGGTTLEQEITIVDDEDPTLTLISADNIEIFEDVAEEEDTIELVVNLSGPSDKPVEVTYEFESGTGKGFATLNEDFDDTTNASNRTLTIVPDQTSGTISIQIRDDQMLEGNEEFRVKISNLSNAEFEEGVTELVTTIMIFDDDLPTVSFAEETPSGAENSNVAIDIELNLPQLTGEVQFEPVEITYEIETGSGDGFATLGVDFTDVSETPGVLTISPARGNIIGSVDIQLVEDDAIEGNEEFTIKITGATNAILASRVSELEVVFTITDNNSTKPEIAIQADSDSVNEGELAVFVLTTFQVSELPKVIDLNVSQDGDYLMWRAPRSINMTETPTRLELETQDDSTIEPAGSITVSLISTDEHDYTSRKNSAVVNVISEDEVEETAEQPRISVAQNAVNAILNTLSNVIGTSPPQDESQPFVPTVSIHAVNPIVEEGGTAEFVVSTGTKLESLGVSVSLQVNPTGDFFDFSEPITRSVHLHGQNSVPISFQTIEDNIAEPDGQIEVTIVVNSAYKIATDKGHANTIISDTSDRKMRQDLLTASSQAFLPDVVGNSVARTTEIINRRVIQGFNQSNGAVIRIGGHESLQGLIQLSGEMVNAESVALRSVLGNSSFAMTLLSSDDYVAPATVWGIGDYRGLSSNSSAGSINWSGDIFTGHIGIDALIGSNMLTGISASFNENVINIGNNAEEELKYSLNTTSLNPYFGWTSFEQEAELRAMAGFGVGELSIDQTNYDFEILNSKSYSLSLAGNKVLYSSDSILNGTSKLSIIGESWLGRQYLAGKEDIMDSIQTDARHYRIRTEAKHQFEFDRGTSLTPRISAGVRRDNKALQSITGMEFIGGLDFIDPLGITLYGTGNVLLSNENTIQKLSLASTFGYDLGNDGLGISFSVSPRWGRIEDVAINTLWGRDIVYSNNEFGHYSNGIQIFSNLGYGFGIADNSGILTVFSGYEFDDQIEDKVLLGTKVSIGPNFGFDIESTREIQSSDSNNNKFQIKGRLNW